jgi:hypothetical protein
MVEAITPSGNLQFGVCGMRCVDEGGRGGAQVLLGAAIHKQMQNCGESFAKANE